MAYIPGEGGDLGRSPSMDDETRRYLFYKRAFLQLILREDECLGDVVLHQLLSDALATRRNLREQKAA